MNDSDPVPTGARCTRAASDLTDVVGELSFETPILDADLAMMEQCCAHCFEAYRVQLVALLLARDRKRAVLLFRAPDAESVRLACRHVSLTIERVWPCSVSFNHHDGG